MPPSLTDREAIGAAPNPLGLDGIEFIEFSTSKPQAFGQVLDKFYGGARDQRTLDLLKANSKS